MAINAKKAPQGGGDRVEQELLDIAGYPARIVQIIDLGLQAQRPYKGTEKPPANEIIIGYELLDEFMKDDKGEDLLDKPRWLSERIPMRNLKADKAKSTQRYLALDPKQDHDGDFIALVGTPCMVNIVHNESNGKVYANVDNISTMRPKEAAKAPELVNPPLVFDLDEPDMEAFERLPDWIQDIIKENLEYNGSALQKALGGKPKPEAKQESKEPEADEEGGTDPDAEDDDWDDEDDK